MKNILKEKTRDFHFFILSGIGYQPKFLRTFGGTFWLANTFEKQGCFLHQKRNETIAKRKFSQRINLWRYSSQCFGPFLCLGRRGKFLLSPLFLIFSIFHFCFFSSHEQDVECWTSESGFWSDFEFWKFESLNSFANRKLWSLQPKFFLISLP